MIEKIPAIRVRTLNAAEVHPGRDWVVYWMVAARRPRYNFALQHAARWAHELGRPLLVLEALRCDYPFASDRLHRFVIDGMADNARHFDAAGVRYYPYLEPAPGAGRGLLEALGQRACLVVSDDFPAFFLPRMQAAAAERIEVRLEVVDGNGLLPLRAAPRQFPTAHSFRRFLQQSLRDHLAAAPLANPLARQGRARVVLPRAVTRRWPEVPRRTLADPARLLADLPIAHGIREAPVRGGPRAAARALRVFVGERLDRYDELRNHPDDDATSGLSPYLHFGHLAAHEIFAAVTAHVGWHPERLANRADGARSGFWGVRPAIEGFLDQLVTWRELGFNLCAFEPHAADYATLPPWARRTLDEHTRDPRPRLYSREELCAGATHDPLWNAAQRQLVREGRMHNALRMLWGKKILEWSPTPPEALATLFALNDAYALDGRDPNSITGITWCLGRFDRPWGPVRPVFGTIRYMSSESSRRKWRVRAYLERYGAS